MCLRIIEATEHQLFLLDVETNQSAQKRFYVLHIYVQKTKSNRCTSTISVNLFATNHMWYVWMCEFYRCMRFGHISHTWNMKNIVPNIFGNKKSYESEKKNCTSLISIKVQLKWMAPLCVLRKRERESVFGANLFICVFESIKRSEKKKLKPRTNHYNVCN